MAEDSATKFARGKRKNETDAEFAARQKREKAAAPAEAARLKQFQQDEARRMATPGYAKSRMTGVADKFRKRDK